MCLSKQILASVIVTAVCFAPIVTSGDPKTSFPLRIRVSRCGEEAVRSREWVDGHVEGARKIFGQYGIEMEIAVDEIVLKTCELTTRAHRHGFAEFASPGAVNVLVAERIQDLDVPDYNLMGVHWRYRGKNDDYKGRHWVFLTGRAKSPVLAHELCHFFGLRHDLRGGNLMAPGPSDPSRRGDGPKPKPFKPILTPGQVAKLTKGITSWKENQIGKPAGK